MITTQTPSHTYKYWNTWPSQCNAAKPKRPWCSVAGLWFIQGFIDFLSPFTYIYAYIRNYLPLISLSCCNLLTNHGPMNKQLQVPAWHRQCTCSAPFSECSSPTRNWLLYMQQQALSSPWQVCRLPPQAHSLEATGWRALSTPAAWTNPHTPHFAPHSSLLTPDWTHGIQPLFCSPHPLLLPFRQPLRPLTALRPVMSTSGSYDPGLEDSASRPQQPPVPGQQHPIDPSSLPLYSAAVDWQQRSRAMPQNFCRKTQPLVSCRPIHTHCANYPFFLPPMLSRTNHSGFWQIWDTNQFHHSIYTEWRNIPQNTTPIHAHCAYPYFFL